MILINITTNQNDIATVHLSHNLSFKTSADCAAYIGQFEGCDDLESSLEEEQMAMEHMMCEMTILDKQFFISFGHCVQALRQIRTADLTAHSFEAHRKAIQFELNRIKRERAVGKFAKLAAEDIARQADEEHVDTPATQADFDEFPLGEDAEHVDTSATTEDFAEFPLGEEIPAGYAPVMNAK